MTYIVTEYCDKCKYTDCVEVCPVEAFHEGPDMLYINPDSCIDCDVCVSQCPVDAIYADDQLPKKWDAWVEINADMCEQYPVIYEKKDPLPTAKTLNELKNT